MGCGGDDSVGIITNSATGEEICKYTMPDEQTVANIPELEEKYKGAMPYFFTQDPDYLELKRRVVEQYCVNGKDSDGVATIDIAIETLKVAEYLTPLLQKQLLEKKKKKKKKKKYLFNKKKKKKKKKKK